MAEETEEKSQEASNEATEKVEEPKTPTPKKPGELKPWQRKIDSPGDAKEGEFVSYYEGTGLIAADMTNKEYLAHREAKDAAKKAKREDAKKRLSTRLAKQREMGAREGVKEYRNSESYKKRIDAAYKRGIADGKPKANLADRLAKKKAKIAKDKEAIAKMEAKVKG